MNHWNIAILAFNLNIKMYGIHPISNNLGGFSMVLAAAQVGRGINVLRAQTPLGSLNFITFLNTVGRIYVTPVWRF